MFMLSVAGGHLGFLVRGGGWVKYPYVKKCLLKSSSPEATSCYVKPGIVFCYGPLCGEYLTRQGLLTEFQGYIVADICEEASQEVLNLIVSGWGAIVSETKCISKGTFVQGQPVFSERQCGQPAVGPLSLPSSATLLLMVGVVRTLAQLLLQLVFCIFQL